MQNRVFSSIALLLLAMLSIQFGASTAKKLIAVVGPETATLLRTSLAALILLAAWRPWRKPLPREVWVPITIYGAALGGMNFLFYFALERIPLGIAVALEFTGPLGLAVFGSRRALDFLWVLLAAIGVALLLPLSGFFSGSPHGPDSELDMIGVAFALAAGACWAFYIHFGHKAGRSLDEGRAATLGMTIAAIVCIPFSAPAIDVSLMDHSVLVLGLFVAVLASALPYSLEMIALKAMPARTFGILMSMEPAVAALVGLVALGELLTLQQWLAIVCVISASLGSTLTTRRQSRAPHLETPT